MAKYSARNACSKAARHFEKNRVSDCIKFYVHIDNRTGLSIFSQFGRKSDALNRPAAEYPFFACVRSER